METTGKHWQAEMPFLAVVKAPSLIAAELAARLSDVGALRLAIQESGHDDYEIADAIGISHGYMSKVLKGTAGLYGKRLVKFMQRTQNLAPLQWLAEQMGCDVVQRSSVSAEVAALRARLHELEKAA
jgi:hypothetical protein